MGRMRLILEVAAGRVLCGLQVFFLLVATSCVHPAALEPRAGHFQYQEPLLHTVPGGRVSLAGGNLIVRRVDLSIDTRLGTRQVAAVYNSASGEWVRSFELRYDGRWFVDASGAVHDLLEQPFGRAIPGTTWVRIDERRIKTKGGLIHTFSAGSGILERVSWSGQTFPSLEYVGSDLLGVDRVTRVDQCSAEDQCQPLYSIRYDEYGCVEELEDRASRIAVFQSDSSCRVRVARDPLDVDRGWAGYRYEYDGGLLTSITSSEGERVEYAYVRSRLRSVTAISSDPGLPDRTYLFSHVYNAVRKLYSSWVKDPRGGTTIYRYDAEGRIVERFDAAGDATSWSWAGLRASRRVEPGGVLTRWEYDDDDATQLVLPSGNVVEVEYAPEAVDRERPEMRPLRRVTDSIGPVEEREYDPNGRLVARTNGANERTTYVWSAEGLIEKVTGPSGSSTYYSSHGEHGHPGTIQRGLLFTRALYDAVGNRLSGGDFAEGLRPSGPGVSRLFYDAERNVVAAELIAEEHANGFAPETHSLVIEYRSDGRRTRIDRPYGGSVELIYDGLGQLSERRERVDGSWSVTRFEHGVAGDVAASELPNGMRREVDYDRAGRPIALRLLRHGTLEQEVETTWLAGRPESRRDSSYALPELFEYDAAGRPLRTHFPDGEVLELTHDLRSRETARRYWAGQGGLLIRSLAFGYDGADRQTQVLDEGELVLEKEIRDGQLAMIRYGNGLSRSFEYADGIDVLRFSNTMNSLGGWVADTENEWESCGDELLCVVSTSYTDDPGGVFEGGQAYAQEAYALGPMPFSPTGDEHGMRVLAWSSGGGTHTVSRLEDRMGYDALGNWVSVGGGVGAPPASSFEFNAERNRLLSSDRNGHHDYAYDEAGFLVQRDGVSIGWNASGKLTSIGEDIRLEWDALGRPIRAIVEGVEVRSLFGGAMQGNAQRQPVGLDLGEVHIDLTSGERRYRHFDLRNNVAFVTDDIGHPLVRYRYSAYGVDAAWGDDEDGVSFARGQRLGDFIILGARIYDPETGRFISPDPIYNELGQHTYTSGNTIFFWDPGGMLQVRTIEQIQKVIEFVLQLLMLLIGVAAGSGNPAFGAALLLIFLLMLMIHFLIGVGFDASTRPPGGAYGVEGSVESGAESGSGSGTPGTPLAASATSSLCAPRSLISGGGMNAIPAWLLVLNVLLGLALIASRRRSP